MFWITKNSTSDESVCHPVSEKCEYTEKTVPGAKRTFKYIPSNYSNGTKHVSTRFIQ